MVRYLISRRGFGLGWLPSMVGAKTARTAGLLDTADSINGSVEADGSSTVAPLTEAVMEEFAIANPGVTVTNSVSGTGGGFQRFIAGEIQLTNASREIAPDEVAAATARGIDWIQFEVAYDGITVAVSEQNDFVDTLTVEQLARIWGADGAVTAWSDVSSDWPSTPIELYGPGADSGTFSYFSRVILGTDRSPRIDFVPSEDDNVLVQGVIGSPFALGFFGYAYYEANIGRLRAIAIDDGTGPVGPSRETIANQQYSPLSRPLFVYVNADMLRMSAALQVFMQFYLENAQILAEDVGFIALPTDIASEEQARLAAAIEDTLDQESASSAG